MIDKGLDVHSARRRDHRESSTMMVRALGRKTWMICRRNHLPAPGTVARTIPPRVLPAGQRLFPSSSSFLRHRALSLFSCTIVDIRRIDFLYFTAAIIYSTLPYILPSYSQH